MSKTRIINNRHKINNQIKINKEIQGVEDKNNKCLYKIPTLTLIVKTLSKVEIMGGEEIQTIKKKGSKKPRLPLIFNNYRN